MSTTYLYLLFPPAAALLLAWGASRSIKKSAAKIDRMRAEQAKRDAAARHSMVSGYSVGPGRVTTHYDATREA